MNGGGRKSLLVVVAHPDDESIWCGGILCLLKTHFQLHILCVTGGGNASRKAEFLAACKKLEAEAFIMDFKDGGSETLPPLDSHLDAYIFEAGLVSNSIACVLTHSPAGEEHWHSQHIQLHRQVSKWARNSGLNFGFFASTPGISAHSRFFTHRKSTASIWNSHSKLSLFAEWLRFLHSLWIYRGHETLKVPIDWNEKSQLLEFYAAQSLENYDSYRSPFEFLIVQNRDLISILGKLQRP